MPPPTAPPTTVPSPTAAGDRWRGVLAGLVAGVVSLVGAWHPSLWADEAATISAAERSVGDLWRMVGTIDLVHGLYYLGMHVWVSLFGTSELSLRLPSAIAIGGAGACVYWLALRLGGRQVALWAAGAFAILPRALWAGTEARPWAITAWLAVAATLVLLVALEARSRVAWVSYSAIVLVGILCNVYLAFLVAAHLISLFLDQTVTRAQRIRWVQAAAAAGVLSAPFLVAVAGQREQLGEHGFGWPDLVQNAVVNQWFLGETPTTTTGISTTTIRLGDVGSWWAPAAVLFAGIGWLLIAYAVLQVAPRATSAAGEVRRALAWCLPWIALPTVVIGVYSVVSTPVYGAHYLTFATPAVAILLAVGLLAIRVQRLRTAVVAVLVLAAIPVFVSQRQLYAKSSSDWVSVAEQIEQRAAPGDGVYFAPRYDVGGSTVGRTTRGIRTAYPDGFDELVDITLVETPEAAGDLVGTSTRLRDSEDRLASVDTLWVIRRVDYPKDRAEEDDAFLASAGFERVSQWKGPLDVVLELERA